MQSGTQTFRSAWAHGCGRSARERGFSQESFAEACDLHRTHVSLLERGRINITVNTARQIAHVLKITLSELFRGLG